MSLPAPRRPFRPSSAPSKEGRALLDLLRARERLRRADGGAAIIDGCVANDGGAATGDVASGDDGCGANDEEARQLEDELVSRLHTLAASIRRRGLFATPERAGQYRARASERSSSSSRATEQPAGGGGSKKRKRPKNPSGGAGPSAASFGIHLDSHSGAHSGTSAGEEMDEGLIVTALCRILGASVGRKKSEGENEARAPYRLVCAAVDVVSSLCHHARDGMTPSLGDASAAVEGEMIGSVAVPLLDALGDTILRLYYSAGNADDGKRLSGLAGGFKACAAVVSVVEARLSRADKTVGGLRETTWLVLNRLPDMSGSEDEIVDVRTAAAALLSTLPLAGNSEGAPPAKLWSQAVTEGVALLQWAIDGFFPVADGGKGGNDTMEGKRHLEAWKEHEAWLSVAKEAPTKDEPLDLASDPTDQHRSKALQNRIECLACYLSSLLGMEGYPLHSGLSSTTLDLPLDSLLDAAEVLLSFPLAAEAKHRATKSRLRASPVKDGLISPNAAVDIAPELRVCGHALFDVAVESCRGGSGALSRARRLAGMAVANLQSSCSVALVSTVDGRRGGVSKMGMWLRGSVPLRAKSITTFQTTMLSLGAGVMVSAGTAKSVARALVLVGGCLLEQVVPNGQSDDDGDEWGTLGERAQLAETAASALASCLAAFGGLIPNDVRGTLDSIVHTCFSTLHTHGSGSIFAYAHVKRAILQLGTNCTCVPWGDGGRSANMEIVRTVAAMLRNDPDSSVATAALSTLCVFDAFATPRAPPLLIPTRGSVDGGAIGKSGFTASSLLQGMEQAKVEMAASKVAAEGKKKASTSKKARKEEAKACTKKSPESTGTPVDVVGKKATEQENHDARESKSRPSGDSVQGSSTNQSNIAAAKDDPESAEKEDAVPNPEQQKDESESKPEVASESVANKKDGEMAAEPTPDPPGPVHDEPVKGDKDEEMMGESDADDDGSSNSSLADFPDIVDEDPDEEDRM